MIQRLRELSAIRRRVLGAAAAVAAVLAVAVVVVLASGGDGGVEVRAGEPGEREVTTTVAPNARPSTTEPPVTTAPQVVSTSTAPPPTEPPPPPETTTTTALVCHDSRDPACGPLRWDPAPDPNQPIAIVRTSPDQRAEPAPEGDPDRVVAGRDLLLTWTVQDPDAHPLCWVVDWGDGTWDSNCGAGSTWVTDDRVPGCAPGYGPWRPPGTKYSQLLQAGHPHRYRHAGTYRVVIHADSFTYPSGDRIPGDVEGMCVDPYRSVGSLELTVTVVPPD